MSPKFDMLCYWICLIIYQMGCYQEGIAKDSVGGKDVTAHIFECVVSAWFFGHRTSSDALTVSRYTSSVIVTETGEVSTGSFPVQILFCLKEQNKKKLNSHRWFFNAFGPLIRPNGMWILLPIFFSKLSLRVQQFVSCLMLARNPLAHPSMNSGNVGFTVLPQNSSLNPVLPRLWQAQECWRRLRRVSIFILRSPIRSHVTC